MRIDFLRANQLVGDRFEVRLGLAHCLLGDLVVAQILLFAADLARLVELFAQLLLVYLLAADYSRLFELFAQLLLDDLLVIKFLISVLAYFLLHANYNLNNNYISCFFRPYNSSFNNLYQVMSEGENFWLSNDKIVSFICRTMLFLSS